MLFNEPKLLKFETYDGTRGARTSFSALQRAEIAEIYTTQRNTTTRIGFSALQRAEIAEILSGCRITPIDRRPRFSALQRAEIAEIDSGT